MFRQEVNLYRSFEINKPAANVLGWKKFKIAQFFFLGLLCISYLVSQWQAYHLQEQKQTLQTQVTALQKQFYGLKNKLPPLFFSQDVNKSIAILKKELEAQEQILHTLATAIPFSQNLTALAESTIPHVWLTSITISDSGNNITLKGNSENMESLQAYLSKLSQSPAFGMYEMNINSIENPKTPSTQDLLFELIMTRKST